MQHLIGKIYSGKLSKAHEKDAGQDIYADENLIILPDTGASVSTNLRIQVPFGYVGLIWPRSGTSFKSHIETGAGVIDHEYTGEVKVKLYNKGTEPFKIEKDDRIAQLLTIPVNSAPYE